MKKYIIVLFSLLLLIVNAHAGCVTRYFVLPAEHVFKYTSDLYPDHDTLKISNLKTLRGPTLADGRIIVKAELPPYLIRDMAEQCAEVGITDPLTPIGVTYLDIATKFAGRTREDIILRYPELDGQIEIGRDGNNNPILVDKFPVMTWACED